MLGCTCARRADAARRNLGKQLHIWHPVPLGQARTTTAIVPPNSSPADSGAKKAGGPFGPSLCWKNAVLSLQREAQSWNQQLRSWQPPWRPGQPPPWSHGPRHSVLCDSSLAGWARTSTDRCLKCPMNPWKWIKEPFSPHLHPQHTQFTWSLGPQDLKFEAHRNSSSSIPSRDSPRFRAHKGSSRHLPGFCLMQLTSEMFYENKI